MDSTYEEQDLYFELETKGLLNKLEISQKENQALLSTRAEIELKLRNYCDLFDQLPLGHILLCKKGLIKLINKKAQLLLETDKNKLVKRCFSLFVHPDSLYEFSKYRVLMLKDKIDKKCEIKCFKKNKTSCFIAQLEGQRIKNCQTNEDELVFTITDITKQNAENSCKKDNQSTTC